MRQQKGFTMVELLIVIAIIGILATVVLTNVQRPRQRATAVTYQQVMQSVRAAAEMCHSSGGSLQTGTRQTGDTICSEGTETYPPFPKGCDSAMAFDVTAGSGADSDWSVTTTDGLFCGGCRVTCTVEGCVLGAEKNPGDCGFPS